MKQRVYKEIGNPSRKKRRDKQFKSTKDSKIPENCPADNYPDNKQRAGFPLTDEVERRFDQIRLGIF
jgi:hypothetical protein